MGTFLRVSGGLAFLAMLFYPWTACSSCGEMHSVFQQAAHANSPAAIGLFLAGLALGALAVLWPVFNRRIAEWEEFLVMAGAAAGLGVVLWQMTELTRRHMMILWTAGVLILSTVFMFLGSMERYRRRQRWS